MSHLAQKLRHVYAPFLAVTAGFVAVYSLLAWALVYRSGWLKLDEDLVTFWLPFGLPWIPALSWLWPRIKLLKLETENGKLPGLYLFVAVATMVGPTILAQHYLSKMTATVSRFGEAAELVGRPATKYYFIERSCLQREGHQLDFASALTGKHQETLTFTISVAVPFCGRADALPDEAPPAWLALAFSEWMPASSGDDQKELRARAFATDAEARFGAMDLSAFTYLEAMGPGAERRGFEAAIHKAFPGAREPMLLVPKHNDFESRAGTVGEWAVGVLGGGTALWLLMLLFPGIHEARLRRHLDGTSPKGSRRSSWRAFAVPGRDNFGTVTLLYVNALVYLAMVFASLGVVGFHIEDLVSWGALARPLLEGSGLVRLVTSQFVHAGLMHLANNLYGLVFAGTMLESVIGGRRLLAAYLVTGTVGGLASVLAHPSTVSVGASGAIFGLFGMLFGLLLSKDERVIPVRNFLLIKAGVFVGLNLLLGSISPGVDNAAHLGGLVAGVLLGPIRRKGSTGTGRPTLRPSDTDS